MIRIETFHAMEKLRLESLTILALFQLICYIEKLYLTKDLWLRFIVFGLNFDFRNTVITTHKNTEKSVSLMLLCCINADAHMNLPILGFHQYVV